MKTKRPQKKTSETETAVMLRAYRKKLQELEAAEGYLRDRASEKIDSLNSRMPKWTLRSIADKLGLSSSAVSKIKAKDKSIGIETIGRVLETNFDKKA
jgi:transcriptional regulator with XRE-family HTH domain